MVFEWPFPLVQKNVKIFCVNIVASVIKSKHSHLVGLHVMYYISWEILGGFILHFFIPEKKPQKTQTKY